MIEFQGEKLRRSMMFVSASNPANVAQADIYGADSVMFDLEDSVSIYQKDAARFLIYNALRSIDYACETVVRINDLHSAWGKEDLAAIVRARPDIIRLPKTECADDVRLADEMINQIETEVGYLPGTVRLMAAIESPTGILNAREIAHSSPRLVAMALGAEDFVSAMKTSRSVEGTELQAARGLLVMACRDAGLYALDAVYTDINNPEGFVEEVKKIRQLGFDGKSCIHPSQVDLVHQVYSPTETEIRKAWRIIAAIEEAERQKKGVVVLDGKMIDGPIPGRARRTLRLAAAMGLLEGELSC